MLCNCGTCGRSISVEADPCPWCGAPDAGPKKYRELKDQARYEASPQFVEDRRKAKAAREQAMAPRRWRKRMVEGATVLVIFTAVYIFFHTFIGAACAASLGYWLVDFFYDPSV